MASARGVVIGIGTEGRGDDAVGRWVIRALRGRVGSDVALLECSGEATALLEAWEGADRAYVVDAVRSGAPAGTLVELAPGEVPAPRASTSSHGLGLAEAVELGRVLGRLPATLHLYGVEAGSLRLGEGLSPEVRRAARDLASRLASELARDAGPRAGQREARADA